MDTLRFSAGCCPAAMADGSLPWNASPPQLCFQNLRGRKLIHPLFLATIFKTRCVDSLLTSARSIHASGPENTGEFDKRENSLESSPPATEQLFEDIEGRGSSEAQAGRVGQGDLAIVDERETKKSSIRLPEEGYVGLFVRMLGLDNPAEDREEAVKALWRHSMGGARFVDQIIEFPGTLTLIVSLLPSNRTAASEAAAGLLRNISALNACRGAVAEAGAVEEITGILTRREISPEVNMATKIDCWFELHFSDMSDWE